VPGDARSLPRRRERRRPQPATGRASQALACYLAVFQRIPYDRMAQLFADVRPRARALGVHRCPRPDGKRGRRQDRLLLGRGARPASLGPRRPLRRDRSSGRLAPPLHPRRLDSPAHPDRVSLPARQAGHGRHGGHRQDARGRRPRRLEALARLRRRPRPVQRALTRESWWAARGSNPAPWD